MISGTGSLNTLKFFVDVALLLFNGLLENSQFFALDYDICFDLFKPLSGHREVLLQLNEFVEERVMLLNFLTELVSKIFIRLDLDLLLLYQFLDLRILISL